MQSCPIYVCFALAYRLGQLGIFKIRWIGNEGKPHEIGVSVLAHGDDVISAGEFVVRQMWPQIHRDNPALSGFSLWEIQSGDEVFRWSKDRQPAGPF